MDINEKRHSVYGFWDLKCAKILKNKKNDIMNVKTFKNVILGCIKNSK